MNGRRRATHRVATSDDVEVGTYLEIAEAESQASGQPGAGRQPPAQSEPTARDAIAIVDFGSQYSQLIARRVREHHVYCELIPHDVSAERLQALAPKGFILSGGPASVYADRAPLMPRAILDSGKPILGICYGMQVLAHQLGGAVAPSGKREYGPAVLRVSDPPAPIFHQSACRILGLDEPRRRGHPTAAGLRRRGDQRQFAGRGHVESAMGCSASSSIRRWCTPASGAS